MFIKYLLCLVSTEGTKMNKTIFTLKQLTISHEEQTCICMLWQGSIFHSFNKYLLIIYYLPGYGHMEQNKEFKVP